MKIQSNKGFTLIELLITIAIIGILSGVVSMSFVNPPKLARDAQRKSDIRQYQNSLETYANKGNGLYPSRNASSGIRASVNLCTDLEMTACPEDPKFATDNSYVYKYQSDGSGSGTVNATKYILWAKLEKPVQYFVVCSGGKTGFSSTLPAPSSGSCTI